MRSATFIGLRYFEPRRAAENLDQLLSKEKQSKELCFCIFGKSKTGLHTHWRQSKVFWLFSLQDTCPMSISFSLHVMTCDKHTVVQGQAEDTTAKKHRIQYSCQYSSGCLKIILLQIHGHHKARQKIFGEEKCLHQSLSQWGQTRGALGTLARRHFRTVIDPWWQREGSICFATTRIYQVVFIRHLLMSFDKWQTSWKTESWDPIP